MASYRSDSGSEGSLEGADEFVDFDCGGAWDFPLSRQEKIRRLIVNFEREVNLERSEAIALREEKEELEARLASSSPKRRPSDQRSQVDICQATSLRLGSSISSRLPRTSIAESTTKSERTAAPRDSIQTLSPLEARPLRAVTWCEAAEDKNDMYQGDDRFEPSAGSVQSVTFVDSSNLNCTSSSGDVVDTNRCDTNYRDGHTSGRFDLQDGEYIRLVRGRNTKGDDDRLAEWIVLWTSQPRKITIGRPQGNEMPTFSYLAAPGHEICGIITSDAGKISGVQQRLLPTNAEKSPTGSWSLSR